MRRTVFCCLVAAALVVGLAFRLARLDLRPMHHDEANQAVKFATLLETGAYRYDPTDHHGPTLYYLTLPAAWLRGQGTLAALDERTLRLVPALFGAALILLLPLLARPLGRAAVAWSAFLVAVSPAFTYYSRFYIQESVFVFFAVGFLIALGRYLTGRALGWAVLAGLFAGLALATKETAVIVLGAGVIAAAAAAGWQSGSRAEAWSRHRAGLAAALGVAVTVVLLLYSSFLTNPRGILDGVGAARIYLQRGVDPGAHGEPWYYYLALLGYSHSGGTTWTEGLTLLLALAGAAFAFRTSGAIAFWPRYVAIYTLLTAAVFSAIAYKTPWNVLPFHAGILLLAGIGAAAIVRRARPGVARAILVVLIAAGVSQLALQSARANFRYPADERNPYVYAQTSTNFLRLVARIEALSALHPDGRGMLVAVVAGPYEQWPLPWSLRGMTRVGYWPHAADAPLGGAAPVVVASEENAPAVGAALGDRYVSEIYGLRPGALLTLYVEKTLWDRFLQSRQGSR
jgi:uncharacterized protein (TIGR03663 family)